MHLRCVCLGAVLLALVPAAASAQADAGAAEAREASPNDQPAANAPSDAGSSETLPPRLLSSAPPVFPHDMLHSGQHPTVVLKVTVFADGSLGDVAVEHSAGEAFDSAARDAVRTWTFAPAQRGGKPIASRVGVAVHFELPELGVHEVTALSSAHEAPHASKPAAAPTSAPAPSAPSASTAAAPSPEPQLGARAVVHGNLRNEQRSVSDFHLGAEQLRAAPVQDSSDLLKRAPGLVVARIEGDAVAPHLTLRGFEADHGQDIELSLDGVPLNQVSHIHGQGYADLGFLIPETVRGLRVTEGVYDPRQGDFAVAGSAEFELGVERRGVQLSSGYGSFHTFRELALYAPEGFSSDTFAAAALRKSDGFGQNRRALSGSSVAQFGFDLGAIHLTLHGSLHAARARTANVLRRDDIEAGRVGFYDVYPYASAEAQGASSQRGQLSLRARYRGDRGENAELNLYFVQSDFRLLANYTGFVEESQLHPGWSGRGDLLDQRNQDRMFGAKARYRSREFRPFDWAQLFLEIGAGGRFNGITQQQDLREEPAGTVWDKRFDADISQLDVSAYLDLDLSLFQRVHLRGGVRSDVLSYRVSDGIANSTPAGSEPEHLPGGGSSVAGLALAPRVSLQVDAARGLSVIGAYGEGYRSAMALALNDGERAPFTRVRSADLGFKYVLDDAQRFAVRASGFITRLSNDLVFEPAEGRAESAGPSRRDGFTAHAETRPFAWAYASLSATYVRAMLSQRPEADPDEPDLPARRRLPYVPAFVLRADLNLNHRLASIAAHELVGRFGAGYTYWSGRPQPVGKNAPSVSVVDAEASLSYRMFRLSLSCFNLFDQEYASLELSYASNWNPDAAGSTRPARHIMAGAPRTLFGTLEVSF